MAAEMKHILPNFTYGAAVISAAVATGKGSVPKLFDPAVGTYQQQRSTQ